MYTKRHLATRVEPLNGSCFRVIGNRIMQVCLSLNPILFKVMTQPLNLYIFLGKVDMYIYML